MDDASSVPSRGSAARAGPGDGDADTSAKRTLSALDSLLGADAPDPFDVALEASARDDDEPAAIVVPLIYTSVPGKGASAPGGTAGGGSLVTGALVDETTLIGSTYVAITVGLPDRSTRAQRERGVKAFLYIHTNLWDLVHHYQYKCFFFYH